MCDHSTKLSHGALQKHLGMDFINLETIPSTNSYAKELGKSGKYTKPLVVLADSQTGGRGRLGRSFYSEGGTGLYMSILLFPRIPFQDLQKITTAAAVALCLALEGELSISASIKWVNDIYLNEKKVSGILTEGSFDPDTGSTSYAVLGIGVNVFSPQNGYPSDISNIATSLFPETHPQGNSKYPFVRERLAGAIVREFMAIYEKIERCPHFDEYRKRLFIKDLIVDVVNGEYRKKAKVIDLLPDFSLLVEYPEGTTEKLISGEVTLRLNKGEKI